MSEKLLIFPTVHYCTYFTQYYRVSQQVWNGLKTIFWYLEACERSELRFGKIVFCSKKLHIQPLLWTAKLKMEFFSNFAPFVLCSNLLSKLLKIGEKLLKNPLSFFTVQKKGWKSNFLERNTNFFCKRCSLRSQTFLSLFQTCWDTL